MRGIYIYIHATRGLKYWSTIYCRQVFSVSVIDNRSRQYTVLELWWFLLPSLSYLLCSTSSMVLWTNHRFWIIDFAIIHQAHYQGSKFLFCFSSSRTKKKKQKNHHYKNNKTKGLSRDSSLVSRTVNEFMDLRIAINVSNKCKLYERFIKDHHECVNPIGILARSFTIRKRTCQLIYQFR